MQKCIVYGLVLAVLAVLGGCASTGGTGTAVLEHQRELAEYKGAVEGYLRRADECAGEIERIRGRADTLGGTIEETIRLFDDYQRAVEQFLRDYNRLRDEVERLDKNADNTGINPISSDSSQSSWLHFVFQGNKAAQMA